MSSGILEPLDIPIEFAFKKVSGERRGLEVHVTSSFAPERLAGTRGYIVRENQRAWRGHRGRGRAGMERKEPHKVGMAPPIHSVRGDDAGDRKAYREVTLSTKAKHEELGRAELAAVPKG